MLRSKAHVVTSNLWCVLSSTPAPFSPALSSELWITGLVRGGEGMGRVCARDFPKGNAKSPVLGFLSQNALCWSTGEALPWYHSSALGWASQGRSIRDHWCLWSFHALLWQHPVQNVCIMRMSSTVKTQALPAETQINKEYYSLHHWGN